MMYAKLVTTSKQWLNYFKKDLNITAFDVAIFLRQFATLISAGIPIVQSCEILATCEGKTALRLLINAIKNDISAGKNLFHCMRRHHHFFDELTCHLIQIGEQTGQLDIMLTTIANYHEKNQTLKQRVKQAIFYPCIITVTALIITICMFIFIIPRFAELFQNTQVQLPLFTIFIFYLSTKLREYLWLFAAIFSIAAFVLLRQNHTNPIHFLRKMIIKFPLIKTYLHKANLVRFTRHLALAISAGIPITSALILTANTCGNIEFSHAVLQLHRKVNAGQQLHRAMSTLSPFPILMVQMVKIGEESGMLESMLYKFAELVDADINQFLDRLCRLLEPLIMVVLGVLIGGLVLGMYLPIFKLGSAI